MFRRSLVEAVKAVAVPIEFFLQGDHPATCYDSGFMGQIE